MSFVEVARVAEGKVEVGRSEKALCLNTVISTIFHDPPRFVIGSTSHRLNPRRRDVVDHPVRTPPPLEFRP
ncbi:hypothetical protein FRC09_012972, partial [Ceratobasidium sp. 395]